MNGTMVFKGTSVPVQTFFGHLQEGDHPKVRF